jgi:hypothetical protein
MRRISITLTALGLMTVLAAAAPAQAEAHEWDHRGGWAHEWHGDRDSGAAIGFGILGGILAGAAIASSQAYAPPAYYYQPPASYYGAPAYYYATPYGYAGYGYYR